LWYQENINHILSVDTNGIWRCNSSQTWGFCFPDILEVWACVESDKSAGCPDSLHSLETESVAQVCDLVQSDRRLTIDKKLKRLFLELMFRPFQPKIWEWSMSSKFVIWLLTQAQKGNHLTVACEFLKCAETNKNVKKYLHKWWHIAIWLWPQN
jgi:hypothetical protein